MAIHDPYARQTLRPSWTCLMLEGHIVNAFKGQVLRPRCRWAVQKSGILLTCLRGRLSAPKHPQIKSHSIFSLQASCSIQHEEGQPLPKSTNCYMAYLTYWLKSHWTPPLFQDIKVLLMYCFRTTLLYPKSINYLLLALKSISDIMPLLSLCRKGREIVCWAFVLCWIFGLRAKLLDLKLPPPPSLPIIRLWLEVSERHFS